MYLNLKGHLKVSWSKYVQRILKLNHIKPKKGFRKGHIYDSRWRDVHFLALCEQFFTTRRGLRGLGTNAIPIGNMGKEAKSTASVFTYSQSVFNT